MQPLMQLNYLLEIVAPRLELVFFAMLLDLDDTTGIVALMNLYQVDRKRNYGNAYIQLWRLNIDAKVLCPKFK